MATDRTFRPAFRALAALVASTLAGTALANSPTSARSQCEIGAFVQETDPAGLNVRAAPNAKAKILGKLLPVHVDPEQGYRTRAEVEVVASDNGWFLIRNARDNADMTGQPERPMYKGEGWVSGSRLIVKSQANVGRAAPLASAPEAGSTVYLDEMNELTPAAQRQLLEILRQREGAHGADVRFIAGVAPRVDDWVAAQTREAIAQAGASAETFKQEINRRVGRLGLRVVRCALHPA